MTGKRERLPYNGAACPITGFQIVDPVLLHTPCSMLHALCPSGPGDEAELVVLLQMGMSRQDADTEAVSAGLARRN
jgi:hypothetical protein